MRMKRQKPQEVVKEMGKLYNLSIKRHLDMLGFPPADRFVVLNFMVELCWKFKKRDLKGVEEVKRKHATMVLNDVCNCIVKLVRLKCFYV